MDSMFTRKDTDEMPRVLKNLEHLGLSNLGILNFYRHNNSNLEK